MPTSYSDSPVIILGMHRSGTSMITGFLKKMGLFVGKDVFDDIHNESNYFLQVNDELLKRVNASWDSVDNFHYFLRSNELVEMALSRMNYDLQNTKRIGLKSAKIQDYLDRHSSLASINTPWGWKDPRTVVTAPLWLKIFPNAKIVYIVRNGVDVASSLQTRAIKDFKRRKEKYDKKFSSRSSSRSKLESSAYRGSAKCLFLEGAFSLWEDYMDSAEKTLSTMSNDKIVIKYEDLLSNPEPYLRELAEFCKISDENIADIASGVKLDRSNAYLNNPKLKEFYRQAKDSQWMKAYGYKAS
jgi:hypothetical protein